MLTVQPAVWLTVQTGYSTGKVGNSHSETAVLNHPIFEDRTSPEKHKNIYNNYCKRTVIIISIYCTNTVTVVFQAISFVHYMYFCICHYVCVCVLPIGKSIFTVSFPWLSSLQIGSNCHSWFCPVLPFWPSQKASFLHSSFSHKREPSQTLSLLIMVDVIDFSSSIRQSTTLLLTLSDKEMFRIFLQSHNLQYHLISYYSFRKPQQSIESSSK